jgi:hypothetical protein
MTRCKPLISWNDGLFLERSYMSNEKITNICTENSAVSLPKQGDVCPALVKKIGKTTYRVMVHFSATNRETMSDKIKRMLRNEISEM